MPAVLNFSGQGIQLGTYVTQSCVYEAYASVSDQSVEVPAQEARYFAGHIFAGKNGNGTDFGRLSVDTTQLFFEYTGKASVEEALMDIFPPPGPD